MDRTRKKAIGSEAFHVKSRKSATSLKTWPRSSQLSGLSKMSLHKERALWYMITAEVVVSVLTREQQLRHPLHYCLDSLLGSFSWIRRNFRKGRFLPIPIMVSSIKILLSLLSLRSPANMTFLIPHALFPSLLLPFPLSFYPLWSLHTHVIQDILSISPF